MKHTKKATKYIALSAVMAALGLLILGVGTLVDVFDLATAALASLLIVFAMLEMGPRWAILLYAVTAALSLLLLPSRFSPLIYALFVGLYPIVKAWLERFPLVLSWIFKFILFNALLTLLAFLSTQVFLLPDTGMDLGWILYAVTNPVFLLYDIALTRLISAYLFRLRRRLRIGRFFGEGSGN